MKNKLLLILALIVITAATASCKTNDQYAAPAGYQIVSNENADYCFYVPDDWTPDMSTAAAGAYYNASDPSSVSVMAWEMEYSDSDLDDWWKTNVEDLALTFTNLNVEEEQNTTLDNNYAKRYTYTADLGANTYKFLQEACTKNGSVYVFTYTSLTDTFDSHLDEVEEMLSFFIIK